MSTFQRVTGTIEGWYGPMKCYPCDPLGVSGYSNSLSGTSPRIYGKKRGMFLAGFRSPDGRYPGFWRKITGSGTFTLSETNWKQDYDEEGNPVGDPYLATDDYEVSQSGSVTVDEQNIRQGFITTTYLINGSPGQFIPSTPTETQDQSYFIPTISAPIADFGSLNHNPYIIYPGGRTESTETTVRANADSSTPYFGPSGGEEASSSGFVQNEASDPDTLEAAVARAPNLNSPDGWQTAAGVFTFFGFTFFGLTFLTPWRLDELADAVGSPASFGYGTGSLFGQVVKGRLGIATNANAGPTIKCRFALKKYAIPVRYQDADRGFNAGRYATESGSTMRRTVVADPMTHPIDALGPINLDDASWSGVTGERLEVSPVVTGSPPERRWDLLTATWEERSWFQLCGDASLATYDGWTQQSRFTVRRIERNASNVVVSQTTAVLETVFDPDRAAPFTVKVNAEPTARGNTVAFSVIGWETRADVSEVWQNVTIPAVTFFRARRTGGWGFQGQAATGGALPTFYKTIGYETTITRSFTDATVPPGTTTGFSKGSPASGFNLTAQYVATLTAPGVFTFSVNIEGVVEGRTVDYEVSIPGCTLRGPGSPGLNPPFFPQSFDQIPYLLMQEVGSIGPQFQAPWNIPSPMPDGWNVTATQHQVTTTYSGTSPGWVPNKVVGGAAAAALIDTAFVERVCEKLPAGHPAAPGYLCATEETWSPASGEVWLIPWFTFMGPADAP